MQLRVALGAIAMLSACAFDPVDVPADDVADRVTLTNLADADDIAAKLAAIPGMQVTERPSPRPEFRVFRLDYTQPVDHDDPDGPTFTQRLFLRHRNQSAPMVLVTAGYFLGSDSPSGLDIILGGNALLVEHRFFGTSIPTPADVQYLTIDQAAADHHRIVQALRPIYTGAWISTGASKGGMTATYHRRRYPDDVDGTIAHVAPLSFGPRDVRYVQFLRGVGDAACRAKVEAFQRQVLSRRETLVPLVAEYVADSGDSLHALPGGADQALDIAVAEFGFQFWQYGDERWCNEFPAAGAPDKELLTFLDRPGVIFTATDNILKAFGSYYYQAVTQLGFPRLPTAHLRDLLRYDPNDYAPYVAAYGNVPPLDILPMIDMALWSLFQSHQVVFIYGENDPWSAGAYPILGDPNCDVHRFVEPEGNHGASIFGLPQSDQNQVFEALERWTGVTPRLSDESETLRAAALPSWLPESDAPPYGHPPL